MSERKQWERFDGTFQAKLFPQDNSSGSGIIRFCPVCKLPKKSIRTMHLTDTGCSLRCPTCLYIFELDYQEAAGRVQ